LLTCTEKGYTVTTCLSATHDQMLQSIKEVADCVRPGDTVVVSYSGHGLQLSGHNYLMPVDTDMTNAAGGLRCHSV
jgi:uncharacterized caspase-like protein